MKKMQPKELVMFLLRAKVGVRMRNQYCIRVESLNGGNLAQPFIDLAVLHKHELRGYLS